MDLWKQVSVDVHKTVCRDIPVLFRNPAPLKSMGPFPGKHTGARISLAALTGAVLSRSRTGYAEGRLHFSIEIKCHCVQICSLVTQNLCGG